MESKKIIEVFVETDEDESYSSSSDDDRVKVATKVSKAKDSSLKEEGKARCVDLGGNNIPEPTRPQLHGREETREPDRMDVETSKGGNLNASAARQGSKKDQGSVVGRHLVDSDASTSSSDSESSDESGDSAENALPENSAVEGLLDGVCLLGSGTGVGGAKRVVIEREAEERE